MRRIGLIGLVSSSPAPPIGIQSRRSSSPMAAPGPTWVRRRFFSGLSTPDLAAVLLRFADCYWNFSPRQRRLWRGCRRIALLDRAMEHSHQKRKSRAARRQVEFSAVIPQREDDMSLAIEKIIDIS